MSDIAIRIEGLSKKYQIGTQTKSTLTETFQNIFNKNITESDASFWALKDISFEIKKGEAVGIIGKNGAGKSTLLKILSRITQPTTGKITINGRIASLLEVGTGFHHELTGRENIFLNGTILGMKRAEIRDKFDEIVAFSGVEKFLDTPVKRYSSGMYVRLAFAVAAHLEPEILIVDEVLAVGDTEFQKKCLGKMNEVSKNDGRTVLFVSHSMGAITNLCSKCVLLSHGTLKAQGDSKTIISQYLNSEINDEGDGEVVWENGISNPGITELKLNSLRLINTQGLSTKNIRYNESFKIELTYTFELKIHYCRIGFKLSNDEGITVFEVYDVDSNIIEERSVGHFTSSCTIPAKFLNVGKYYITVNAGIPNVKNLFRIENVMSFEVESVGIPEANIPDPRRYGVVLPNFNWTINKH